MITKVKGTQDLLDLKIHNFVLDQIKKHLHIYNYSEIQTPIIEHTKLFIRSLGEYTDVVSKEMYILKNNGPEDDDEDSICLRPEATAGTIRAFIENKIEQKPWKVFTYGPMFRHERPQKGRWRQFSQINIENINSESILSDVQFIKMLDLFFADILKMENYIIKINFLGCIQDRQKHKESLTKYLDQISDKICPTCNIRKEKNILRIFDCKNETCKNFYKNAPQITDFLCNDCQNEWDKLKENLSILSVSFIHETNLVRGLDYYNKTVFEFSSNELGAQDAFCGGGRYNLGKEIGSSQDYPAVGAGIGMGRLLSIVEQNKNKLAIPQEAALHIIIPMSKDQQPLALILANELQVNKFCTDILLEDASIKSLMRKADKSGAKYVLILGEDEQKNGTVTIKNMITSESVAIKQKDAITFLKK